MPKSKEDGLEDRRRFLTRAAAGLGVVAIGPGASALATRKRTRVVSELALVEPLQPFGFVMHGGAGTILRSKMTPELDRAYQAALTEALTTGYNILKTDGNGLDAVEAAIRILEDSPLFNAGKGAVLTSSGTVELDSSIMDGSNLKAGAVATLRHIKNPISLARMVMERSPHVMMVEEGAEEFAKQQGVVLVPESYFITEKRRKEYEERKAREEKHSHGGTAILNDVDSVESFEDRHGTVGAAALDKKGNLTAGTSTGGISYKRFGRVGDSPIIGAGTYANNLTCAISGTGDGEFFIRSVVAHDISALMQYGGKSISEAAHTVIDKVGKLGGTGGVIGIDKAGNVAQVFNTEGMYRGRIDSAGKIVVEIYKD